MFRYTRGFRGADFGNLNKGFGDDGEDSAPELDSPSSGGSGGYTVGSGMNTNPGVPAAPVANATTTKKDDSGGGGLLDTLGKGLMSGASGGLSSAAGGLCGCANKDKQAQDAAKAQIAQQYPTRDCGPDPAAPGYAACLAYNKTMLDQQAAAYQAWLAGQNAAVGQNLSAPDKAKFAAVSALAKKLVAAHPDAAEMTLAQVQAKYPDDFAAIYKQIQAAYPELANVDAKTALAMAPQLAGMKVKDLIQRLDQITAQSGVSGPVSSGGGVTGILIIGGLLAAAAAFMRSRD